MKPYVFCIISVLFSISSCEEDESYKECNSPFNCGNLQNLYYPFWSSNRSATCGQQGFKLTCIEAQLPIISIQNQKFRVVSVNQSVNSMTIAREDYWENLCPQNYANTTLNKNIFYFPQTYPNISFFYKCRVLSPQMENIFPCSYWNAFYATDEKLRQWGLERPQCEQRVNVPIPSDGLLEIWYGVDALKEVLRRGFDVSYEYHENCWGCHDSGGICGSNSTTFKFICLCPNKPYSSLCPVENGTAAAGMTTLKVLVYYDGLWDEHLNYSNHKIKGILVKDDAEFETLKALIFSILKVKFGETEINIKYQLEPNQQAVDIDDNESLQFYI